MIERLRDYLNTYEWDVMLLLNDVLLTGFNDQDGVAYPITIALLEDVVVMRCSFQTVGAVLADDYDSLRLMLYLNYLWPLAKLGLNDEGDLVLSVDIPRYELSYDSFIVGLEILVETAQAVPQELGTLLRKD